MNNKTLDQKRCIDSNKIINTTIKLQRKNQISNPKESIYESVDSTSKCNYVCKFK